MLVLVVCFAGIPAISTNVAAAETEVTYYSLQILADPLQGTTSPPPGIYNYVAGTTAILTAVPDDDWPFLYWIVLNLDTGGEEKIRKATIKILMDEDHLAHAYFGAKHH